MRLYAREGLMPPMSTRFANITAKWPIYQPISLLFNLKNQEKPGKSNISVQKSVKNVTFELKKVKKLIFISLVLKIINIDAVCYPSWK